MHLDRCVAVGLTQKKALHGLVSDQYQGSQRDRAGLKSEGPSSARLQGPQTDAGKDSQDYSNRPQIWKCSMLQSPGPEYFRVTHMCHRHLRVTGLGESSPPNRSPDPGSSPVPDQGAHPRAMLALVGLAPEPLPAEATDGN